MIATVATNVFLNIPRDVGKLFGCIFSLLVTTISRQSSCSYIPSCPNKGPRPGNCTSDKRRNF